MLTKHCISRPVSRSDQDRNAKTTDQYFLFLYQYFVIQYQYVHSSTSILFSFSNIKFFSAYISSSSTKISFDIYQCFAFFCQYFILLYKNFIFPHKYIYEFTSPIFFFFSNTILLSYSNSSVSQSLYSFTYMYNTHIHIQYIVYIFFLSHLHYIQRGYFFCNALFHEIKITIQWLCKPLAGTAKLKITIYVPERDIMHFTDSPWLLIRFALQCRKSANFTVHVHNVS